MFSPFHSVKVDEQHEKHLSGHYKQYGQYFYTNNKEVNIIFNDVQQQIHIYNLPKYTPNTTAEETKAAKYCAIQYPRIFLHDSRPMTTITHRKIL